MRGCTGEDGVQRGVERVLSTVGPDMLQTP